MNSSIIRTTHCADPGVLLKRHIERDAGDCGQDPGARPASIVSQAHRIPEWSLLCCRGAHIKPSYLWLIQCRTLEQARNVIISLSAGGARKTHVCDHCSAGPGSRGTRAGEISHCLFMYCPGAQSIPKGPAIYKSRLQRIPLPLTWTIAGACRHCCPRDGSAVTAPPISLVRSLPAAPARQNVPKQLNFTHAAQKAF